MTYMYVLINNIVMKHNANCRSNRLLIIHGLNDENVLFTHTSLLCDKLVEFAKPYQLQLYTGERHGLRSPPSVAHCDATVLTFLLNNL